MFAHFVYRHDRTLVHPADLARLDQICGRSCCLWYDPVGESEGYLLIEVEGTRIRLKPEATRRLPAPGFAMGQHVRTTNGTPRVGWIAEIGWHYADRQHLYYIEVEGSSVPRRRISRRYHDRDLELMVT